MHSRRSVSREASPQGDRPSGAPTSSRPFQIFSAGLLFRTSYKISDSLARAMGTVYQRAWRQGVYAFAVVIGSLVGSSYGLEWVAVGVTAAIILNYFLMAQLSLTTAPVTWWQFTVRQTRGLVLAALVAAASVPTVMLLRGADAGDFLVVVGGVVSGLAAMAIAWLIAPKVVLGEDGLWLLGVVKSRGPGAESVPVVEVGA